MTNGEKLDLLFPDGIVPFSKNWLDAEYKEPTPKESLVVEDCISRVEVLKLMKDNWHTHNGDWAMQESMDDIRALPSVEPKTKAGHWIEYTRVLIPEPINKWEQAWYCSECGYGNQDCEDGSAWLEWNYCPNCGALMVEEQGENTDGNDD